MPKLNEQLSPGLLRRQVPREEDWSCFSLTSYDQLQQKYEVHRLEAVQKAQIVRNSLKAKKWIEVDELTDLQNRLEIYRFHLRHGYKVVRTRPGCKSISSIAVDSPKNLLLYGTSSGQISLVDLVEDNDHISFLQAGHSTTQHRFEVTQLRWWPFDAGMFVSGSSDRTIQVWDTSEMASIYSIDNRDLLNSSAENYGLITSCDFSSTLQHGLLGVSSQGQNYLKLYDMRTMEKAVQLFDGKKSPVDSYFSVKWSPVDENVIAGSNDIGGIDIWDVRRSDRCLDKKKHGDKPLNGLAWDSTGGSLVSCGVGNTMKRFYMAEDQETVELVGASKSSKNAIESQKKRRTQGLEPRFVVDQTFSMKNRYLKCTDPILTRKNSRDYLLYPTQDSVGIFSLESNVFLTSLYRKDRIVGEVRYTCVAEGRGVFFMGNDQGKIETWGPDDEELFS